MKIYNRRRELSRYIKPARYIAAFVGVYEFLLLRRSGAVVAATIRHGERTKERTTCCFMRMYVRVYAGSRISNSKSRRANRKSSIILLNSFETLLDERTLLRYVLVLVINQKRFPFAFRSNSSPSSSSSSSLKRITN